MVRSVLLDAFRPFATVLTDSRGDVAFANRKAAALLGCPARRMIGRRCWEVVGMVDPAGNPFCSHNCRVQRQARRGALRPRHRVVSNSGEREARTLDLLAFVVPPRTQGRQVILHLMIPADAGLDVADAPSDLLDRLTAREAEILSLLATGHDTESIAARLYISPTTVRNHVQHILGKLGVHGRLQAILSLLQSRDDQAK